MSAIKVPYSMILIVLAGMLMSTGCAEKGKEFTEVQHFPLDELAGIVAGQGILVDRTTSLDGNGSLQITADRPTVFRLFELANMNVENSLLVYRAGVRTADVRGRVYLEMLCHFPELGEYFSRDLQTPLSGTTDWSIEETPFYLLQGQNPDSVKLNLVFEGSGTVWIDDIYLLKGPLPPQ